jgi:hypothetical protein
MLSKEKLLEIWSPPDALWSPWVKTVLFSFCDANLERSSARTPVPQLEAVPPAGSSLLIVDLPGEQGVVVGMELARIGYRPIPLYNALPFPLSEKALSAARRSQTTVDVVSILTTICRDSETLKDIRLSPVAPPAFLLDADRRIARIDPAEGIFDNRSVCFETDFPSADFLLAHGIGSAVVAQNGDYIAGDLAQALLKWQARGIHIQLKDLQKSGSPRPVVVQQPSLFRRLRYRLSVALSVRRTELAAFGRIVPSSG